MKTFFTIIFFTTSFLFSSCQQDRNNLTVSGQITDEATGQPIANAEVLVVCWYMHNIEEASIKEQTIITDNNGNYTAHFDKGHQIDVASKAKGYSPLRSYNNLKKNRIQVNLKLSKSKANPTLVALMNTDILTTKMTDSTPFLRILIHGGKDRNNLDLKNIETYGFDFKTLTTKTDTTQCDFWFRIVRKKQQPTTIVTNGKGGIIPVYFNEIESSFLYEKTSAPITGYKKEYSINGQEEGFFILCRDGKTYAKIILEKADSNDIIPEGEDFGKFFSYLYQANGSTDLSYPQTDINLKQFLTDYRMK